MFCVFIAKRNKSNLGKTIVKVLSEMSRVTTIKNKIVTFSLGRRILSPSLRD